MGTLSLAAPLVLSEKSRLSAGTGFHLLPSLHQHPTQLHYTKSYSYSHPNLNFLQHCTDTLPTRNVVCPSDVWFENRPHLTPSIRLARNPKHVIVQWVGIRTDRHLWYRIQGCAKVAHCVPARWRNFPHYCRRLRRYDVFWVQRSTDRRADSRRCTLTSD